MIKNNYLGQRERYLKQVERQEQLLWGIILGFLLILVGSFNYFFVLTNTAALNLVWVLLIMLGCLLFILAFSRPSLIRYLQIPLKQCGNWLGKILLKTILFTVYFLIITPLGLLVQRSKGTHPFYYWDNKAQRATPLWEKKTIVNYSQKRMPMFVYPIYIIYFMVENKAYIVIPLVCILLLVAMLVFFMQTPVVAPFVYTLF